MSCLNILVINPLLVTYFTNIFSHSVGCHFILFMFSFAMQKLVSLMRSCLFIFVFVSIILAEGSKKILLQFMSESVLPLFSSKIFIVFNLTFRPLIHFELIFVYGVKNGLISFFTWSCPVFPAPFVEETCFPTLCNLAWFVII